MPEHDIDDLFLPALVEPQAGVWTGHEVDLKDAAVDTKHREFWVPKAYTEAQDLAHYHELGHVKYSPDDWEERVVRVTQTAGAKLGKPVDSNAVHKILKQLEENRIDWLVWSRHGIDIRPCREALDWGQWPAPTSTLEALGWSLQLAWTVWASRGLGGKHKIKNPPPVRVVDPDTAEYFDTCWGLLVRANPLLARVMIRACMRMYAKPTDDVRDGAAAELSTFFPLLNEEKEQLPPPKPKEQQAQQEAKEEEREREEREEKAQTGVGGELVEDGEVQYHDHTLTIRRQSMRIARKEIPVTRGPGLRFPHRYYVDGAIFGQRLRTEAGLMIDGSKSMQWTDQDMQTIVEQLPAITVGVYSGLRSRRSPSGGHVFGRICTIAKDGRFARYDGLDREMSGANDVDYEALRLLASWPRPRLWLSDGMVCGGKYVGPSRRYPPTGYFASDGHLYELCAALMKAHEILRVPDRETMHALLARKRVTLYRTAVPSVEFMQARGFLRGTADYRHYYPTGVDAEPIQYQL